MTRRVYVPGARLSVVHSIPRDLVLLDRYAVTRRLAVEWTAVSTLGFFVSLVVFGRVYAAATGTVPDLALSFGVDGPLGGAVWLAAFVALTVAVVPLAANAGGAVGDLWMALTVLRYPSHVAIGDDESGLTVYGRPGDRSLGEAPDLPVRRAIAATGVTFLALVVGAFLSPILLGAAGIETVALAVPGLGELVTVPGGASGFELSVRPDTALLASVVVGVVTTAVSVAVGEGRRGRRGGSTTPPASGPGTQPK